MTAMLGLPHQAVTYARDHLFEQTVEQLARGEVGEAIEGLQQQGRIHEVKGHPERIARTGAPWRQKCSLSRLSRRSRRSSTAMAWVSVGKLLPAPDHVSVAFGVCLSRPQPLTRCLRQP